MGKHVYLRDNKGYLITDIPCPVRCGCCCFHWKEVDDLQDLAQKYPHKAECPNKRKWGCRLKRSRRPMECRMYLCELGALALMRNVGPHEALHVVFHGQQKNAIEFLGLDPAWHGIDQAILNGQVSIHREDLGKINQILDRKALKNKEKTG